MGVVSDVQTYLVAQSLVDGATGWTSVVRRVFGDGNLVVITEDGGRPSQISAASGIGASALKDPAVQIRVRGGTAWDGNTAFAKAQAIFDALHGLLATTVGVTLYLRVAAQTSEPVFIGFDEANRPQFTMSFRMMTAA